MTSPRIIELSDSSEESVQKITRSRTGRVTNRRLSVPDNSGVPNVTKEPDKADWVNPESDLDRITPTPGSGEQGQNEEPDWVRAYSATLPSDEARRKAILAEFEEEDDDSFFGLGAHNGPSKEENMVVEDEKNAKKPEKNNSKKGKLIKPRSSLPIVVANKLDENITLLQTEGTGMDLSGDVGAVGRVKEQNGELYMDIKGIVYRGLVQKTNTLCMVSIGEDEAKITARLNHAVTLCCERDLFAEGEVIVHGNLDEDKGDSDPEYQDTGRKNGKSKATQDKKKVKAKGAGSAKKRGNGNGQADKKTVKRPRKRKASNT